jgi:hypothetical protein
MDTTTMLLFGATVVTLVLYLVKRRSRLSQED